MGAPDESEAPPADVVEPGPPTAQLAPPPPLPPPPSRWLYRTLAASGFAIVGGGIAFFGSGFVFAPLVMLAAGGVNLAVARHGLRAGPGVDRVAAASVLADLGAHDEASALLDVAERENGAATVLVASAVLRAQIAADGEGPREALAAAERALQIEVPSWQRAEARSSTAAAHGARALAAAELGDAEAMRSSIASARAILGEAGAEAGGVLSLEHSLAQIALAEAIELGRSGERDALRAHVDAHGPLLASATRPRERALYRALLRTLDDDKASPYRRVESRSSEGISGGAVDEASPPRVRGDSALQTRSGSGAFGRTARGDRGALLRVGGLVGAWVLAMVFAFLANFLAIDPPNREWFFRITMALPLVFLFAIMLFAAVRGRRQRTESRELRAALVEGCAHPPEQAHATALARFARAPDALTAARANLALARRASLDGHFEEAGARAEEGLRRLQGRLRRAVAAPDLLPSLAAERALARAALGDTEAALAEAEALPAAFAHRAPAVFSVRLVALVRADRLEEASALAQRRPPGAALSAPIEALADLLLASSPGASLGAAVRMRLAKELAGDDGLRRWLDRVAPEPLHAFLGEEVASGPRIVVAASGAAAATGAPKDRESAPPAAFPFGEAAAPEQMAIAEQELLDASTRGVRRRSLL